MGLDLIVGGLAIDVPDEEYRDMFSRDLARLNDFLIECGRPIHDEPHTLPEGGTFEAQMWGYSGLHYIRRLAAHHAITGQLPPPGWTGDADPVVEAFYHRHRSYERQAMAPFPFNLFGPRQPTPFEHLMWHSDAEGFYLPQLLKHVLFDFAGPDHAVPGGMVGSSPRLLDDCLVLASLIDLPADIDPEDELLWQNAEDPAGAGPLWHIYGVEAFGLARLIRACTLSVRHGAALVFA